MKIGLFFSGLTGGGTQRRMLLLARGLIARGHAVQIIVASAAGPFSSDMPAAARLVDLESRGRRLPLLGRHRGLWVPLAAPALAQWLKTDPPDVLVASSTPANLVATWARAQSAPGLPLVPVLNLPPSAVAAGVGPLRRPLLAALRRAYRQADGLVAISNGVKADAALSLGLEPAHITVVPNPVAAEAVAEAARVRPEHPWLTQGGPPVVLALGKLQPQKDFATLLHAFARLRSERTVRLMILGDGPLRRRLEALVLHLDIAADVAMPGFVAAPFGWLGHTACVVSSSRFEGFSNVLVEALAAGATIVATDCPHGPADVLAGGTFGRLVPVGDAAALAEAMAAALDAPADPAAQRQRAQTFSLDAAIDGYLDVIGPLARPLASAA